MKTILFAWELGEGFGHVGPLRCVARELSAKGYRAVFAARDVGTRTLVKDDGYPVLQAPIWRRPNPRGHLGVGSYADILAIHGFADADDLSMMVAAWQDLFDVVKPDLIVADHSPTACLAAYGAVPVALIGNGFTLPPVDRPEFPSLRPGIPPTVPEQRLLEVVHDVQRRRKRPAPETLPALLASPVRSVCTLPELDPYLGVRGEPVVGPLEPLPARTSPPAEPALFAYCAADYEAIDDLVLCLADVDVPVSIYFRGRAGSPTRFLKSRGLHVYDDPPLLAEVLPTVTAVLSHGGSFAAHAALTAGRPHVMLPRHLEAKLTAGVIEMLGVGMGLSGNFNQDRLGNCLRRVLHEPDLQEHALLLARAIEERETFGALSITVSGCLGLLSQ